MILRFLQSLLPRLVARGINVCFYYTDYNEKFIHELRRYEHPPFISLYPMTSRPPTSIELYQGNNIGSVDHHDFERYHDLYYGEIQAHLGLSRLPAPSLWVHEPSLDEVYQRLPEPYKSVEIIIVNSLAFSSQFNNDMSQINNLARTLSKTHRVVTTVKVDDILCTTDSSLFIQDIGAIATRAKYVIGINTGPICSMYTTAARTSVKKWFFITTHGHHYVHRTIDYTMISDGNLSPIYDYFRIQQ